VTHDSHDIVDRLLDCIEPAKGLGFTCMPNGTLLTGHVPHVGPDAWLHVVYAPLTVPQLGEVEGTIKRALPAPYRALLLQANGLSLFSGSLSLYGLRTDMRRSGEAVWQPFSIGTPNTVERPPDAAEGSVFFGGYRADGSRVYLDAQGPQVHRCSRTSSVALNSWPDLSTFLLDELTRLAAHFDEVGRRRDPGRSTAPSPDIVG
jgi:hypothetical protein